MKIMWVCTAFTCIQESVKSLLSLWKMFLEPVLAAFVSFSSYLQESNTLAFATGRIFLFQQSIVPCCMRIYLFNGLKSSSSCCLASLPPYFHVPISSLSSCSLLLLLLPFHLFLSLRFEDKNQLLMLIQYWLSYPLQQVDTPASWRWSSGDGLPGLELLLTVVLSHA